MITFTQHPAIEKIEPLLASNSLPTADLHELDLSHFFLLSKTGNSKGVIGLEVYESIALLRSMAVTRDSHGLGYGTKLLHHIEQYAISIGIENLYLLTDTASTYFESKHYQIIDRKMAPESIQLTTQFSDLCPGSALLMWKYLK